MDDIILWLASERDYRSGVDLLAKHHPNRVFVDILRRSTPKRNLPRLEYELKKILKASSAKTGGEGGVKPGLLPGASHVAAGRAVLPAARGSVARGGFASLPDAVKRAKDEIYSLHTSISVMHRQLYELGEGNSPQVVAGRKALLTQRLPLIERYERLYLMKEEYFDTGKVPGGLVALLDEKVREGEPAGKESGRTGGKGDAAGGFSRLSDMELMKKRQSLKVSISKVRNRLEFQALRKMESPNPMPEGPLRDRLLEKLGRLRSDYAAVCELIGKRQ